MWLKELVARSVDAVWMLADVPSDSIEETNRRFPIRLLDLWKVALGSDFFKAYPFYTSNHIPAGTYKWQTQEILTFQNPTLWVANRELDDDFAYRALKILFSEKVLTQMRTELPVARDLDAKKGLGGVVIPLHPDAVKFLRKAL